MNKHVAFDKDKDKDKDKEKEKEKEKDKDKDKDTNFLDPFIDFSRNMSLFEYVKEKQ